MQDPQVKTSQRNFLFGYVRFVILGVLAALILSSIGLALHWRPEKTVKRQQATLVRAIETRKGARFRRLLSNEYEDRWGFDVDDMTEAMLDVRSQFIALGITSEDESIVFDGKTASLTTKMTLKGTPIGGGSEVMRHINRLKDPWVFTWEKQSFLPSSWRLVKMENLSIPQNVWNYEPGSIRARRTDF